MKSLCNATNGFMILADSFAMAIFKQSFLRTLATDVYGDL
jgi:protein transport protein SEC23